MADLRRYLVFVSTLSILLATSVSASARAGSWTAAAVAGQQPLQTAILDQVELTGPNAELAAKRVRAAGATAVRLLLSWREVAPAGERKPAGFQAANPGDSKYNWRPFDALARVAVSHGLEPIVDIVDAPDWAQGPKQPSYGPGAVAPNPVEFGRFARAAATRYSGSVGGLPRVRFWEVWNEPNISLFLNPQFVDGKPTSPAIYRAMVNRFATGVKAVHTDNLVIAGSTAPFRDITGYVTKADSDWGPLSFMRDLLCLSKSLKPTCSDPIRFDIWSHHPYTSGGPTHHAVLPNDVSLGDLPEMQAVLTAGFKAGHIRTHLPRPGFWVTEFSWDSNPPDPQAVPIEVEARWVAQALYKMWRDGVSLVTWFSLRDPGSVYQSGLYYNDGATLARARPKPALEAFRFPVVAFPRKGGGVYVWGRTPSGNRGRVVIEQSGSGSGWKRLGLVPSDRYGIFERDFTTASTKGEVRARLLIGNETSVPFSLKAVPDHFYNPFGGTHPLEPTKRSK